MHLVTFESSRWARSLAQDIDSANSSVTLTALSFLPPRGVGARDINDLWRALVALRSRRVALVVILPAPTSSHPATARNGHAADALCAIGARVTLLRFPPLLHAKTVAIDDRIAWVGSGNMTAAAAHHNREAWLVARDPAAVVALRAFHRQLLDAHAENH